MKDSVFIAYHYCSLETFQKILKSKVLWLCDLTDSNDEDEVSITFVKLWEEVKRRLRLTDIDEKLLNNVINQIDQQYQIELQSEPPYGICFCKKEDISSQWKEYGDATKGLSLGFDINWFIKNGIKQQKPHPSSIQSHAIGCDAVIYNSSEFEEEMTKLCYKALKQNGMDAWLTIIRPTFKHYSGFLKNSSFEPEQEIRIVYYPMETIEFTQKDIVISGLKNCVKKHYELPWIYRKSMALKSICIGHNCELKIEEIIGMLIQNEINVNEIEIKYSSCSYRLRE